MANSLVTKISRSPSRYERPRILMIDECCNNVDIAALAERVLRSKDVDGCFPIWDQARVQEDGSVIHVRGGYAEGGSPEFDWGKPKKRHSFPDLYIAQLIEAQVKNTDVFFLSENTRMNEDGVRMLLRDNTKREPNTHLVAIYKGGKTEYPKYCEAIELMIHGWEFSAEFEEFLVHSSGRYRRHSTLPVNWTEKSQ